MIIIRAYNRKYAFQAVREMLKYEIKGKAMISLSI